MLVPNFAVQVARILTPELDSQPLIVGGLPFEAKAVFDASPEAVACGVKAGMPLHEAYSILPEARFFPLDEGRYADKFEHFLSILEGFSPVVEMAGLGCAYLDGSGIRDEEKLAYEVGSSISSQTKLSACVGISSGKFLSWAAAFSSKREVPIIVPGGREREFIAPFSIDLLPCSAKTKERLKLFGICVIGELVHFSKDALATQFGKEGTMLYELAHGIDTSPLIPRKKPQAISAVTELDRPTVTHFEIFRACEDILDRLVSQAKAGGKVCYDMRLKVGFPSGLAEEKRLPLKEATSSRQSLAMRLKAWLEEVTFPEPVEEVRVSLVLEPEKGRKVTLWPQREVMRGELARAVSELRKRFGYQPIKKSVAVEPQPVLPEKRLRLIDFD